MLQIKTTSYSKNYHPAEFNGICVVCREKEDIENLIKRFKKKFAKSGIIKEDHEKMYYEKPSDKKRRKRIQNKRAREREENKLEIQIVNTEKIKYKFKKEYENDRRNQR